MRLFSRVSISEDSTQIAAVNEPDVPVVVAQKETNIHEAVVDINRGDTKLYIQRMSLVDKNVSLLSALFTTTTTQHVVRFDVDIGVRVEMHYDKYVASNMWADEDKREWRMASMYVFLSAIP